MSILIKGMDMPKEEGRVLKIFPDGRVAINLNDNVAKAVEIPPHGRLIDADALHYSRVRIYHEDGTVGGYNAVVMSAEIKDAPTIIEAEEERRNG